MREEAKKTKPTVEKRKAFINPLKEYSHNLGVPSTDSGGPKKQSSVGEEHGTSASVKSPAEYVDANGNRHVYAGFGNGAYVKATTAKDFDSNPIEPAWITNPLSSSDDGDALGTTIVRPKQTASAYFRKPLPRLVPVSVVGTSSEDSDDESPGSPVSSYDSAKGPSADHGSLNATASSKTTHSEWSGPKMVRKLYITHAPGITVPKVRHKEVHEFRHTVIEDIASTGIRTTLKSRISIRNRTKTLLRAPSRRTMDN